MEVQIWHIPKICKNHTYHPVISPCLYPTKTPHPLPDNPTPTPAFSPKPAAKATAEPGKPATNCAPHDPKPSLFHTDVSPSTNHFILHTASDGSTHIWCFKLHLSKVWSTGKYTACLQLQDWTRDLIGPVVLCPQPILSKDQRLEEKEEKNLTVTRDLIWYHSKNVTSQNCYKDPFKFCRMFKPDLSTQVLTGI